MNRYKVRLDPYNGWKRVEEFDGDSYEVIDGGVLEIYVGDQKVATFASGKWVYIMVMP